MNFVPLLVGVLGGTAVKRTTIKLQFKSVAITVRLFILSQFYSLGVSLEFER